MGCSPPMSLQGPDLKWSGQIITTHNCNIQISFHDLYFKKFFINLLSVLCGILLCCCVTYRSLKDKVGGPIHKPENPVKWFPQSLRQTLTCISITELTFSCHFNILPMHTELRHQTRRNKRIILFSAMGLTYVMNFIVSFFGYFQVLHDKCWRIIIIHFDDRKSYPNNIGFVLLTTLSIVSFSVVLYHKECILVNSQEMKALLFSINILVWNQLNIN